MSVLWAAGRKRRLSQSDLNEYCPLHAKESTGRTRTELLQLIERSVQLSRLRNIPASAKDPLAPRDRVLRLVGQLGVLRPRDLKAIDVPREYLRRLRDEGLLDQPSRGLYVLAEAEPTEHQTLVEVCKRVPAGAICLLSALQLHELTTQLPHEVWLALAVKAWAPKVDSPRLRITRFSPASLAFGVEEHRIGGSAIRVFSTAKTVADCFKFRSKVGLDVALEALRDSVASRKATRDEIWQAARVCRVTNVMRPYLEALA